MITIATTTTTTNNNNNKVEPHIKAPEGRQQATLLVLFLSRKLKKTSQHATRPGLAPPTAFPLNVTAYCVVVVVVYRQWCQFRPI